jgi:hypothetical protein
VGWLVQVPVVGLQEVVWQRSAEEEVQTFGLIKQPTHVPFTTTLLAVLQESGAVQISGQMHCPPQIHFPLQIGPQVVDCGKSVQMLVVI